MKLELQRIDLWSAIKIVFMLSLILGFILSLFYASLMQFMGLFLNTLGGENLNSMIPLGGIMTGMVIVFGTFGIAIIYTILAAIMVILYNFMAGWAGGVVLYFKKTDTAEPLQSMNSTEKEG